MPTSQSQVWSRERKEGSARGLWALVEEAAAGRTGVLGLESEQGMQCSKCREHGGEQGATSPVQEHTSGGGAGERVMVIPSPGSPLGDHWDPELAMLPVSFYEQKWTLEVVRGLLFPV